MKIDGVNVNINDKLIQAKLDKLMQGECGKEIHDLLYKMCDPYVPFLEGPLSQTVHVTPQYVEYKQPYAHYQYVGEHFNHTIEYHPLATAYWDKAMMQNKGDSFVRQVEKIIGERWNSNE